MRRRNLMATVAMAAVLVVGSVGTTSVQAAGYWNMPGTLSQRAGHGFSGGYHAPLVLGPIRLDGFCGPNDVRLRCSPSPYCGCGYCGDCGRMVEATSSMEGVVPTAVLPTPALPTVAQPMPAPPTAEIPVQTPTVEAPAVAASEVAEPIVEPTRPIFDVPPVQ